METKIYRITDLASPQDKAALAEAGACIRAGAVSYTHLFIDDGVSGVTFDRPGWNEMIGLAEAGKVKTVIVKDMSRMGRDYLKVGYFFAERDIRYIAINDGVDSDKGDNDFTPFRNLFNNNLE